MKLARHPLASYDSPPWRSATGSFPSRPASTSVTSAATRRPTGAGSGGAAVFRSDTLHRLTTADLEHARQLGVRTVIDLRSTDELTEGAASRTPSVAFHHLPLFEDDAPPSEPIEDDDPSLPRRVSTCRWRRPGARPSRASFGVIAEGDHAVVFHCAAGKDRTGILAALLLSTLGVADDLIVADYHLSEHAVAPGVRVGRGERRRAGGGSWPSSRPGNFARHPRRCACSSTCCASATARSTAISPIPARSRVLNVLRARLLEP